MDDRLKRDLEQFLGAYATMRKYQKSFFSGNKAALTTAKYWENQADNYAKKVEVEHKIELPKGKGNATQGSAF